MKFAAVIVVVFVAGAWALTDDQNAKAKVDAQECTKEIGVKPEDVQKFIGGDFTSKDEKIQCFAKCYLGKHGFLNDKGDLLEKVVVEKLSKGEDKAKVEAVVSKCKTLKGANACETAYKLYECYHNNKAF